MSFGYYLGASVVVCVTDGNKAPIYHVEVREAPYPLSLPTSWKQGCSLRLIQETPPFSPTGQQPTCPQPSCWFWPRNRTLWPEPHVLVTSLSVTSCIMHSLPKHQILLSVFSQLSSAAAFFFLANFWHLYKFEKLISSTVFFPLLNLLYFWLTIYECVAFYEQWNCSLM